MYIGICNVLVNAPWYVYLGICYVLVNVPWYIKLVINPCAPSLQEKSKYKESFDQLREHKKEIEHLHMLLEQSRVRLQRDFEVSVWGGCGCGCGCL